MYAHAVCVYVHVRTCTVCARTCTHMYSVCVCTYVYAHVQCVRVYVRVNTCSVCVCTCTHMYSELHTFNDFFLCVCLCLFVAAETCSGSGTQTDSCGRRCTCKNGKLMNCCRVRKEWHSLTQEERCLYTKTLFTASTKSPWKACYDKLIEIHTVEFLNGVHDPQYFLPWHRWFILSLENLLRQIDCL